MTWKLTNGKALKILNGILKKKNNVYFKKLFKKLISDGNNFKLKQQFHSLLSRLVYVFFPELSEPFPCLIEKPVTGLNWNSISMSHKILGSNLETVL